MLIYLPGSCLLKEYLFREIIKIQLIFLFFFIAQNCIIIIIYLFLTKNKIIKN